MKKGLILLTMTLATANCVYADENSIKSNLCSVKDNVVQQINLMSEVDTEWENVNIEFDRVLFDFDNEYSAYLFSVTNENKQGYLIASNDEYNHIIEYGDELFLDEVQQFVSNEYDIRREEQKTYYLGGLNYAIGDANDTFLVNVIGDKCYETSKNELQTEENSLSTPDNEGDPFITNPDLYESGYSTFYSHNVANYNLSYKTMSSFSSGGVCAPTAATNLMYYWYNRGSRYNRLMCISWNNTFNYISNYMETTLDNGTYDSKVATGYTKYLNLRGYESTVEYHSGTNSGRALIPEIDAERPCHLILHGHYKYGDHSVLALGYKQYVYSHWYGNSYETYIRIADGWTATPNRYVWGNCSGNWNYVTVHIN